MYEEGVQVRSDPFDNSSPDEVKNSFSIEESNVEQVD